MGECPDSWENMSKINSCGEEEHMVYGCNLGDRQQDMDLETCAILHSACSDTVCGKKRKCMRFPTMLYVRPAKPLLVP